MILQSHFSFEKNPEKKLHAITTCLCSGVVSQSDSQSFEKKLGFRQSLISQPKYKQLITTYREADGAYILLKISVT